MNICVFGASSSNIAPEYFAAAEELGALMAKDGHTLVFGGGSGAGITINPIAFLVVSPKNGVSLLPIDQPSYSAFDKIIDNVPGLIEKVKEMIGKKSEDKAVAEPVEDAE